ncbi:MAG TPA: hypothetical protein ENJ95_18340 [Bacteroidetes bacterium]|nr:hypothetical protein [Bacteroidota bacterium]
MMIKFGDKKLAGFILEIFGGAIPVAGQFLNALQLLEQSLLKKGTSCRWSNIKVFRQSVRCEGCKIAVN